MTHDSHDPGNGRDDLKVALSLDTESPRECACGHQEWQHVWNSVALPDGRGPFSTAACSDADCACSDYVDAEGLETMAND